MSTIEITARDFRDLVTPVIPHVGASHDLPVLQAVRLITRGGHLLALTTDRYSLAICRHKLDDGGGQIESTVPLHAVKQILSVFRVTKLGNPLLRLTCEGDLLTVTAAGGLIGLAGATLQYKLEMTTFPKVEDIITAGLTDTVEAVETRAFNTEYLARFRAAARNHEPVVCRPALPAKPMIVTVGDHFVGAIMPVRLGGDSRYKATEAASWETLLDPKPAVRKRAAKKATPAKKTAAPRKRAAKKTTAA